MKKLLATSCFFILVLLLLPTHVRAAGAPLVDQANLFNEQEKAEITERVLAARKKTGVDIGVVTTSNTEGKTAEEYADDYYDYNGYEKNGVLLLIDMDNRRVHISTSGSMIRILNDQRIEKMLDGAFKYMPNQDYTQAVFSLIKNVERYAKKPGFSMIKSVVAFVIALIGGGITYSVVASRYNLKSGTYQYPYREHGKLQLTNRTDLLINTYTTSRRIPRNNGGGGGSGSSTHTSSSGSSHGGGGRSF